MHVTVNLLEPTFRFLVPAPVIFASEASGVALINQLHSLLINDGRMDDLKKSINDSEYQEKLIREYKLNEID